MMQHLMLETPRRDLVESYRTLVREFTERDEPLVPFVLSFPHDDFDAFLYRLDAASRGEDLPDGFVPHSTFWLVREDATVVGVSNLRHRLTDALRREGGNIGYGIRPSERGRGYAPILLRETLRRAREMGLCEVLLTCGKNNVPSVRTIRRNAGHFISEEYIESRGEFVQRYRITLGEKTDAL